jgi:hypothetical protein
MPRKGAGAITEGVESNDVRRVLADVETAAKEAGAA